MEISEHYLISPNLKKFNKFEPKLNIAVLASGEGSNFQVLIDLCKTKKLDIDIKLLITNKENAGCMKRAIKSNIPNFLILEKNYENKEKFEAEIIKILKESNVELIVMAGWMKIASEKFVNIFKDRIINIHPSLLPSFKGVDAIQQAMDNKVTITGCTVHYVQKEVDSGSIIIQAAVPLKETDSKETLKKRIQHMEHIILPLAIGKVANKLRNSFKGNK